MKKSMLILLFMFLMSACNDTENPQKIGENPPVLTTAETAVIREKTTTQTTTVIDFENLAEFQDETKFFEETVTNQSRRCMISGVKWNRKNMMFIRLQKFSFQIWLIIRSLNLLKI